MSYETYLKFYNLEDSEEHYEDWLANEHRQGRAIKYDGVLYSVESGEAYKPYTDRK